MYLLPKFVPVLFFSPNLLLGFPGDSDGQESACSARYLGSIPGFRGSPGEGKDYPIQYSCLENSLNYVVHGVAKSGHTWVTFTSHIIHYIKCRVEENFQIWMIGKTFYLHLSLTTVSLWWLILGSFFKEWIWVVGKIGYTLEIEWHHLISSFANFLHRRISILFFLLCSMQKWEKLCPFLK